MAIAAGQQTDDEFDATGSPDPQSITFPGSAAASGSLIIVIAAAEGISAIPSFTLEDNKSNSYTEQSITDNALRRLSMFYKINATGGSGMSFTVTPSQDCKLAIAAIEFTGVKSGTTIDGISAAVSTGSDTPSTGTLTVSHASELAIGAAMAGTMPFFEASGWTAATNTSAFYSFVGLAIEWRLTSSNIAATWDNASSAWLAAGAAFNATLSGALPLVNAGKLCGLVNGGLVQ